MTNQDKFNDLAQAAADAHAKFYMYAARNTYGIDQSELAELDKNYKLACEEMYRANDDLQKAAKQNIESDGRFLPDPTK